MQKRFSGPYGSRFQKNGGFTLIELIVSIAVFSVCTLLVLGLVMFSIRVQSNAARRSQSSNSAASVMEGATLPADNHLEESTTPLPTQVYVFKDSSGVQQYTLNGPSSVQKTIKDNNTGLEYNSFEEPTLPGTTIP